ncbi:MAG TPA: hypothetical protein VFI13_02440, partial [Gemmatimonadales bacterium]|nr:hypothetical protein [Gemmatimonadales bacterium]
MVRGILLVGLSQLAPARAGAQTYAAVLDLAGGPLYFTLHAEARGPKHEARICTGPDCIPATWTRDGDSLRLAIPDYDAVMVAAVRDDSLDGYYHNVGRLGPRTVPFRAERRPDERIRRPRLRAI